MAPDHGLGRQPSGKDEVRAMNEHELQPTENADDLEEVPVKRGANRGAVVSVRLNSAEAQDLADAAGRAGMSISQFARTAIRSAIHTQWQLRVWSSRSIVRVSQATGGSFGRLFWPALAREQQVVL